MKREYQQQQRELARVWWLLLPILAIAALVRGIVLFLNS
jgi:hypothetical protein